MNSPPHSVCRCSSPRLKSHRSVARRRTEFRPTILLLSKCASFWVEDSLNLSRIGSSSSSNSIVVHFISSLKAESIAQHSNSPFTHALCGAEGRAVEMERYTEPATRYERRVDLGQRVSTLRGFRRFDTVEWRWRWWRGGSGKVIRYDRFD